MTPITLFPSVHPGSSVELRTIKVYTDSPEVKMVASEGLDAPTYLARCAGAMAKVTEQPDIDDDCWRVINHRGQDYSLLGPIRYFNNDCGSNATFASHSSTKLVPRINTKVKDGDEITLFYGRRPPWSR
ncbi:hypothetical protein RMATCC62417_18253 [Rhizopus microsporus]|nr:hypothetical protein RMATCC62417_18253 [Rhizopus microsporus]